MYSKGYKVIIGNSLNNPQKEKDYLNQLLTKQIDGLIVGTHNSGIKEYEYKNLPIVSIERTVSKEVPVIECDNYNGGVQATKYLYGTGCRNIVHTTGRTQLDMSSELRDKAYMDTMNSLGLKPKNIPIYFDMSIEEKQKHFENMFAKYPKIDGVFAGNDIDAAMILKIARQLGKKIPENFRVIGFDGTKLCRSLLPDMPTIAQPIELMAFKAIEVLEKKMQGQKANKKITLPITLYPGNI